MLAILRRFLLIFALQAKLNVRLISTSGARKGQEGERTTEGEERGEERREERGRKGRICVMALFWTPILLSGLFFALCCIVCY